MQSFLDELANGVPDADALARIVVRLVLAALLGAVVGIQRERVGKPAGLRTHMLVSVGAALFVLTTAAGIWLTAGVGVTVGLGHWGLASIGALLTWLILAVLFKLEPETKHRA